MRLVKAALLFELCISLHHVCCDYGDRFFAQLSVPEYGNCYTFNSNISSTADLDAGDRVTTMMGPNSGKPKFSD